VKYTAELIYLLGKGKRVIYPSLFLANTFYFLNNHHKEGII